MLTAAQVDAYKAAGFVALGPVLDDHEIEALLEAEERFRPRVPADVLGANRTLLVRTQLCHKSETVRWFATQGRHIDAVIDLLGPNVALTHQQFVTKLPDEDDTTSEISLDRKSVV